MTNHFRSAHNPSLNASGVGGWHVPTRATPSCALGNDWTEVCAQDRTQTCCAPQHPATPGWTSTSSRSMNHVSPEAPRHHQQPQTVGSWLFDSRLRQTPCARDAGIQPEPGLGTWRPGRMSTHTMYAMSTLEKPSEVETTLAHRTHAGIARFRWVFEITCAIHILKLALINAPL